MDTSGIYKELKNVNPFVNPFTAPLQTALNKLTPVSLQQLTDMATAQAAANGLPMPSNTQLSNTVASLSNAVSSLDDMLKHTNVLTGVDLNSGSTITSLAKLGNAAKMIEQAKGCELSTSVMGALQTQQY